MAHKTLIGGTAYEIKGGKTLIGGTGYEIKGGKTLVGGTGYNVKFGTPIGSLPVGSTVYFNVNGAKKAFIVVHQGLPSADYDASCNGTWLLMKDVYEKRQFHTSNASGNFYTSALATYLNGTFLGLIDSDVREQIKSVSIPCRNYANRLNNHPFQIFLLSGVEVDFTKSNTNNTYLSEEGACLSYFSGADAATRIAYLNGTAQAWWIRSARLDNANYAFQVRNTGSNVSATTSSNSNGGVRPAFVLPSDFDVTNYLS